MHEDVRPACPMREEGLPHGEAVARKSVPIPDVSCWPGISAQERAYRESVLRDVRERVRIDGEHVARSHPDRARQFMPFSALKGYHEMAAAKEEA